MDDGNSATSTTNRIPNLNEVELDRLIDGKLEQAILSEARRFAKEKVRMEDFQAARVGRPPKLPVTQRGIAISASRF